MNSKRRIIQGKKMFIPINLEGGMWSQSFFTTPKVILLAFIAVVYVGIFILLKSIVAKQLSYIVIFLLLTLATQKIIRIFVLEENYYYKMYVEMDKNKVTSPNLFWNLLCSEDATGTLNYADGKVGIGVQLVRDTTTGRNDEFKEKHYDAFSDFYKAIVSKGYKFVQMNTMEPASGNDARLKELDVLLSKKVNDNLDAMIQDNIAYIKYMSRNTYYESEYVIIYTDNIEKRERLLEDVSTCASRLMAGAYVGYAVLGVEEIVEFVNEEYGTTRFNFTNACETLFSSRVGSMDDGFEITDIKLPSGEWVSVQGDDEFKEALKEKNKDNVERLVRKYIYENRENNQKTRINFKSNQEQAKKIKF